MDILVDVNIAIDICTQRQPHAGQSALALEAAHLRYTYRTLYAEPIDRAWVEALAEREDLAEPDLFLEALLAARPATELLLAVVGNVRQEAANRHLIPMTADLPSRLN